MGGYSYLSTVEWREKQTGLPIDRFSDKVLFLAFQLNRLFDDSNRNFQKRRCCLNQLVVMDSTVTILSKLLEDVTHTSLRTNHRIPWNAQSLG